MKLRAKWVGLFGNRYPRILIVEQKPLFFFSGKRRYFGDLPFLDAPAHPHCRTPMGGQTCKVSFALSAPDRILSWQVADGSPMVENGLYLLFNLSADAKLLGSSPNIPRNLRQPLFFGVFKISKSSCHGNTLRQLPHLSSALRGLVHHGGLLGAAFRTFRGPGCTTLARLWLVVSGDGSCVAVWCWVNNMKQYQ